MITERIIKALLKSKIIYNFELIYNHDRVSAITSLSMFLLWRLESLLLAGLAKFLVLKKCFCFLQEVCFSFFKNGACKFQKDVNRIYKERQSSFKIKLQSFKLPRSVFSILEISMILIELFVVSFKWNLFFELPWEIGMLTTVVVFGSLSGGSPNTE